MIVWLIWIKGDDHTWLEAAWDDDMTVENPTGWKAEVDRVRKIAFENSCDWRIQRINLGNSPFDLFVIPEVNVS